LKKVFIADSVAVYATPAFRAADSGVALSLLEAWGGALAYTAQLYFDFSGYSDMAIGLALLFGLKLPINFNSPYKAQSIIDFWRRWHMTLSRFLRDYLYIPLGGNRHGAARRWINLLITMLLGGLWHGAAWTFVIWGGLHGLYLCINHAWQSLRSRLFGQRPAGRLERAAAWGVTFLAVIIAWVFFRAETLSGALSMLDGMSGGHGLIMPEQWENRFGALAPLVAATGLQFAPTPFFAGTTQLVLTLGALLIALIAPNTQEIVAWQYRGGDSSLFGRRGPIAALLLGLAGAAALIRILTSGYSEFLYFQF
jgi:alginate O-acetyltransferase complex protein AlgI